MKKVYLLIITLLISTVVITGCGKKENKKLESELGKFITTNYTDMNINKIRLIGNLHDESNEGIFEFNLDEWINLYIDFEKNIDLSKAILYCVPDSLEIKGSYNENEYVFINNFKDGTYDVEGEPNIQNYITSELYKSGYYNLVITYDNQVVGYEKVKID